jgi:hypothetical protein
VDRFSGHGRPNGLVHLAASAAAHRRQRIGAQQAVHIEANRRRARDHAIPVAHLEREIAPAWTMTSRG